MLPISKDGNHSHIQVCQAKGCVSQMTPVDNVCRVMVADDEPEFRNWLKSVLDDSEDFRLIGEVSSGTEALQLIPSLLPD